MAKATEWYANERAELGSAFADALDTTIARVLQNPYMYAIVTKTTRRAPVPGFQHGVFYQIHDNRVVVTACTHYRRHPRRWRAG